mmetsp:Transcript_32945/g.102148  ORF Transcript_32945/g.102148 Transcript_32945/m.102148 type:complete len:237 (+) Transcript_32945:1369-2079(+)
MCPPLRARASRRRSSTWPRARPRTRRWCYSSPPCRRFATSSASALWLSPSRSRAAWPASSRRGAPWPARRPSRRCWRAHAGHSRALHGQWLGSSAGASSPTARSWRQRFASSCGRRPWRRTRRRSPRGAPPAARPPAWMASSPLTPTGSGTRASSCWASTGSGWSLPMTRRARARPPAACRRTRPRGRACPPPRTRGLRRRSTRTPTSRTRPTPQSVASCPQSAPPRPSGPGPAPT